MNRKILLMILFSFAAHMAVAAVVAYLPSSMNANEASGYHDKVIWGYVSGGGQSKGMRQSRTSPEPIIPVKAEIRDNHIDAYSHSEWRNTSEEVSQMPSSGSLAVTSSEIENPIDHSTLYTGSPDSGDSTCKSTSQCGSSDGQTGKTVSWGFDNHAIMEYVRKQIEKHKYYPHIAKMRGIEGTVYLNFYIGQDGIPGSIAVYRSSGSDILDQAGIETVMKIGKISNINKELRELDIVVPITYKLE